MRIVSASWKIWEIDFEAQTSSCFYTQMKKGTQWKMDWKHDFATNRSTNTRKNVISHWMFMWFSIGNYLFAIHSNFQSLRRPQQHDFEPTIRILTKMWCDMEA